MQVKWILMKVYKIIFSILFFIIFCGAGIAKAQLREAKVDMSEYRGPVFKKDDPSEGANLSNLFNMTMSHSYSMTFGSVGGRYQNVNMYTNTMRFYFTDKLTGRLDLSLLHSPFGSSRLTGLGANEGVKFIVRNAELNYQISDNASIHVRYQQLPYSYRRFGSGFGRFSTFSPFPPLFR